MSRTGTQLFRKKHSTHNLIKKRFGRPRTRRWNEKSPRFPIPSRRERTSWFVLQKSNVRRSHCPTNRVVRELSRFQTTDPGRRERFANFYPETVRECVRAQYIYLFSVPSYESGPSRVRAASCSGPLGFTGPASYAINVRAVQVLGRLKNHKRMCETTFDDAARLRRSVRYNLLRCERDYAADSNPRREKITTEPARRGNIGARR